MNKFKVGEKVKLVRRTDPINVCAREGAIGTVKYRPGYENGYYTVEFRREDDYRIGTGGVTGDTFTQMVKESQMEHVLQVGDRVRITARRSYYPDTVKVGALGTIKDYYSDGSAFVKLDGYSAPSGCFDGSVAVNNEEFEAVAEFKLDDRVKLIRKTDPGVYVDLGTEDQIEKLIIDLAKNLAEHNALVERGAKLGVSL